MVTLSRCVGQCLKAAEELKSKYGVDVEVINLRSIKPMDVEAIVNSVKKTGLMMAVESGFPMFGVGAELIALTVEYAFDYLDAPPVRVTGAEVPTPYAQKLEEMRATVDEKLHATLQTRLTESFGAVTDQLTRVHTGLGEMSKLSSDVGDLSRIFTNVKSRGGFAEVQLGMLLGQMLAPNQFSQNVKVKPLTGEMVEYAVKLPTPNGDILLPIDAKFPREAWERLETAYGEGTTAEIAAAGKAFEAAIRTEGKRICEKYIAPPATTNFAVMFLPTEGLYAEVMRRDGLQSDIQQSCRVTIAGPSTLSALLNSFQMGFHMLHMQQKGDEVWKVLEKTKDEFTKFEGLMGSMEKQVGTVQNTIEKLNTRTRAINRSLRDVSLDEKQAELDSKLPNGNGNGIAGFDGFLPMLAASEE